MDVRKTVSFVLALSMTGCATIIGKGGAQSVSFESAPSEADVVVKEASSGREVFRGKTPTQAMLEKQDGFFGGKNYEVTISKDGFKPLTVSVETRVSGWYLFGNLIFGGPIGWLIVDPATGAMWKLSPEKIDESLVKSAAISKDGFRVVLLQDVPEAFRGEMRPVIHH